MVTLSAEVGGPDPPHVDVLLQLPDTEAVYDAARTEAAGSTTDKTAAITSALTNIRAHRHRLYIIRSSGPGNQAVPYSVLR